jgi:hypothetical protein
MRTTSRSGGQGTRCAVDGLVVGFFAGQTEGAEDGPLDVVGQAGQDLLMIVLAEAVEVRVDGLDVL